MNFKYYLTSYKKQDSTQALRLKIETSKNDVQYIDANISLLKTQWDSKKQIVKRHSLEEQLNAKLNRLLKDVKSIYYKNDGVSAKRLLDIYKVSKKHNTSSFLDFYQDLVDEMHLKNKVRSAITNQKYIVKLKQFKSTILFSDLSVPWAKEYEKWMLNKGNKTNTIASNFKAIYASLNKAVDLGLIGKNPIKGYKIVTENSNKEILTINEIQKIIDIDIESRFKGIIEARDMFLFSFYTAGMRFSDMCKLKNKNISDDFIIYTMEKSKSRIGAKRYIPLNVKSKQIIEKYKSNDTFLFKILRGMDKSTLSEIEYQIYIRNNSLNKSLKILAKRCKINKSISMHTSKHSFADYAVKGGLDVIDISQLLGHTKLSTTQHYLKDFYPEKQVTAINKLFN